jgi:hypothetical protein
VPSLRKLEQFDQIMDRHGLWGELSRLQVRQNLDAARERESHRARAGAWFPGGNSMSNTLRPLAGEP